MTIFIILIALLIVAAGFIGRSAIMARIDHTPEWVFEAERRNDSGMSALKAMDFTIEGNWDGRHPKDIRCRRHGRHIAR